MKYTTVDIKHLREKTGAGLVNCKNALVDSEGDIEKAIQILKEKGIIQAQKKQSRTTGQGIISIGCNENLSMGIILKLSCETDFVARTNDFLNLSNQIIQSLLKLQSKCSSCISLFKEISIPEAILTNLKQSIQKLGENIEIKEAYKIKVEKERDILSYYIHPGNQIGVLTLFELKNSSNKNISKVQELFKDINMQIAAMIPQYIHRKDVPEDSIEKEKSILQKQIEDTHKPKEILNKIIEGKLNQFYKDITLLDQVYIKDSKKTVQNRIQEINKELQENIQVKNFIRISI